MNFQLRVRIYIILPLSSWRNSNFRSKIFSVSLMKDACINEIAL